MNRSGGGGVKKFVPPASLLPNARLFKLEFILCKTIICENLNDRDHSPFVHLRLLKGKHLLNHTRIHQSEHRKNSLYLCRCVFYVVDKILAGHLCGRLQWRAEGELL